MIQIEKVTLNYSDECALNDISLHIKKGELVSIVGASGSGKTSLLSVLSGVNQTSHGSVLIEGIKIDEPRLKTSYILQDYGLLPWKTVYENIVFPFKRHGIVEDQASIKHYAEKLGIASYFKRYPQQLSGGQKQRVAITRALCLQSDLLLMDEAFSALDSLTKESLQDYLLEMHQQEKQTVLFVTHNIEEAVYLGSRIIIMKEGSITHDLNNNTFGQRDSLDYFKMCKEVRGFLHE